MGWRNLSNTAEKSSSSPCAAGVSHQFRCLPLSPIDDKRTLFHLQPKILATKWQMDIDEYRYWRPWTSTSPALSQPKFSKASAEKQTSK
jgi:hypothetical protein